MKILKENNTIWMGLIIGASFPVLGFVCIELVFDFLTTQGLMDAVTSGSSGKRNRTIALMSICSNIIPIQVLNNKYILNVLKGVLVTTFIYSVAWLINFGDQIIW